MYRAGYDIDIGFEEESRFDNKTKPQSIGDTINQIASKAKRVSMEDALRDIVPMPWSKDVLDGKKKVTISKQK